MGRRSAGQEPNRTTFPSGCQLPTPQRQPNGRLPAAYEGETRSRSWVRLTPSPLSTPSGAKHIAGFSSMFYLAAFHASVTSACSRIDAGAHCFLFARRSCSHCRSPLRRRVPRPRFCGDAPVVKVRCALSSDSQQTSSTRAKAHWLGVLTARSKRLLIARPASLRRRGATGVSTPQNHSLRRPSCSGQMGGFARHKDRKGCSPSANPVFPEPLTKKSAFKPHR